VFYDYFSTMTVPDCLDKGPQVWDIAPARYRVLR
jgi:hypothetical protein